MPDLEWRPSPSYPDYEVSERGDVRRIKPGIRGGFVGKVMKPYRRDDGYNMFILRRDNRSFHVKAHQLVIEAFVGPKPFPDAEVCHGDGTRDNDHWTNLRWGTRTENRADQLRHGTLPRGRRHGGSKLNDDQVFEIRRRKALGLTATELAARFGVSKNHIYRVERGERWLANSG